METVTPKKPKEEQNCKQMTMTMDGNENSSGDNNYKCDNHGGDDNSSKALVPNQKTGFKGHDDDYT